MPYVLTTDQKTRVAFSATDSFGNEASIDGVPRWQTSDPAVVYIAPHADGRSADIVTAGRTGSAQVTVHCDADLGGGVRELVGVLDVDVVGGEAVMIALTPGAAEDKDAPMDEPEIPDEPAPAPDEPEPPAPAPDEPAAPVPTPGET